MWFIKPVSVIVFVACTGIMGFRTWYWADNCVLNSRTIYPPVYQCGIHPLDFSQSYLDMERHNRLMSDWIKSGMSPDKHPYAKRDE